MTNRVETDVDNQKEQEIDLDALENKSLKSESIGEEDKLSEGSLDVPKS